MQEREQGSHARRGGGPNRRGDPGSKQERPDRHRQPIAGAPRCGQGRPGARHGLSHFGRGQRVPRGCPWPGTGGSGYRQPRRLGGSTGQSSEIRRRRPEQGHRRFRQKAGEPPNRLDQQQSGHGATLSGVASGRAAGEKVRVPGCPTQGHLPPGAVLARPHHP